MIKQFLEHNAILRKLCIRMRNKLKIEHNECHLESIQNSSNTITMHGTGNSLSMESHSMFQECSVQINGTGNRITIGSDTALYGETNMVIHISGDNNEIIIGDRVSLRGVSFFIRGNDNRIEIGNDCSAVYAQYHIEQDSNEICIGNGTTMHGRGHQAIHMAADEGSKIIIEEDCMLAHSTQIRSTDSHSIVDLEGNRLNPAKDIVIGPHCWIGLQCIILKGTTIPSHCVVAAGSVCSKVYQEQNCLIAGNPAKIVKYGIDWDRKFIPVKDGV